jgi:hypothetical protein
MKRQGIKYVHRLYIQHHIIAWRTLAFASCLHIHITFTLLTFKGTFVHTYIRISLPLPPTTTPPPADQRVCDFAGLCPQTKGCMLELECAVQGAGRCRLDFVLILNLCKTRNEPRNMQTTLALCLFYVCMYDFYIMYLFVFSFVRCFICDLRLWLDLVPGYLPLRNKIRISNNNVITVGRFQFKWLGGLIGLEIRMNLLMFLICICYVWYDNLRIVLWLGTLWLVTCDLWLWPLWILFCLLGFWDCDIVTTYSYVFHLSDFQNAAHYCTAHYKLKTNNIASEVRTQEQNNININSVFQFRFRFPIHVSF